jgi:hypothetical protein
VGRQQGLAAKAVSGKEGGQDMTWVQQNSKRADAVLPVVTDTAAEQILEVLRGRSIPEDVAVRLNLVNESLMFEISPMRPDDMMFVFRERVILLVDAGTALSLAGHTFDSRQTADGRQFVLRSPEETEIG